MTKTSGGDGFEGLGLDKRLLATLGSLGYEEPTPVQREAIPALLAGRDVQGLAATGTGKTAAFALPMLQRLAGTPRTRTPRGLVLVPTRELAMQVAEATHRYGRGLDLTVLPVYGGQWIGQQLKALARGVDIVVATPGRALDLMERGKLTFDDVAAVVLDEADEMLDLGFADDLEAILDATPPGRQTALFSATMPKRIAQLAAKRLRDPVPITVAAEMPAKGEMPKVRQTAYVVPRARKNDALARVLDFESPASAIVFCRTRGAVDELAESLAAHGHRVEAIHGGLTQVQRDRVMKRFREGGVDLLIATDVAARGLDIPHLSHVVNYDLPGAPEAYVHRIGRTGRAGREGVALSFIGPREQRFLHEIERLTRQKIEVAAVPTVADLRSRRLELTKASVREAIGRGGLEPFRAVVEALGEEFDVADVAAAALKLAQEGDQTPEPVASARVVPAATPPPMREEKGARPPSEERTERPFPPDPRAREERPARPFKKDGSFGKDKRFAKDKSFGKAKPFAKDARPARDRDARRGGDGGMSKLYVGAGQSAGMRPGDLVGALVKGGGLDAQSLGSIYIGDHFSIVEVGANEADAALKALQKTTLRGRKVPVRPYRPRE